MKNRQQNVTILFLFVIEFLNLFPPIPVLAALQLELDPSIPLFEPYPLGLYVGWWW